MFSKSKRASLLYQIINLSSRKFYDTGDRSHATNSQEKLEEAIAGKELFNTRKLKGANHP